MAKFKSLVLTQILAGFICGHQILGSQGFLENLNRLNLITDTVLENVMIPYLDIKSANQLSMTSKRFSYLLKHLSDDATIEDLIKALKRPHHFSFTLRPNYSPELIFFSQQETIEFMHCLLDTYQKFSDEIKFFIPSLFKQFYPIIMRYNANRGSNILGPVFYNQFFFLPEDKKTQDFLIYLKSNGFNLNALLQKAVNEERKSISSIDWLLQQGASFSEYPWMYTHMNLLETAEMRDFCLHLKPRGLDFNELLKKAVEEGSLFWIDWLVDNGAVFNTKSILEKFSSLETLEQKDFLLFLESKGWNLTENVNSLSEKAFKKRNSPGSQEKILPDIVYWLIERGAHFSFENDSSQSVYSYDHPSRPPIPDTTKTANFILFLQENGWDFQGNKGFLLGESIEQHSLPAIDWLLDHGASFDDLCYLQFNSLESEKVQKYFLSNKDRFEKDKNSLLREFIITQSEISINLLLELFSFDTFEYMHIIGALPLPETKKDQNFYLFLKDKGLDLDQYKDEFLNRAISDQSIFAIDFLLEQGASFDNVFRSSFYYAFNMAVSIPETQEMQDYILLLHSKGLNLSKSLGISVGRQSIAAINWLIEHGASFDNISDDTLPLPETPKDRKYLLFLKSKGLNFSLCLNKALKENSLSSMQWLLSQGASFENISIFSAPPLPDTQKNQDYILWLKNKQWDWEENKGSLLLKALEEKSISAIEWLVEQGASFPEYLHCYLPLPSDHTSQEYILFLKSKGLELNDLLIKAVEEKSISAIEWLVEQGASFPGYLYYCLPLPSDHSSQEYILFLKSKGLELNDLLIKAVQEKSIPAIDWLLTQGTSLPSHFSDLPLPSDQSSQEYILFLKSKGLELNDLLIKAVQENSITSIEWLIAQGASFPEYLDSYLPLPSDQLSQNYILFLKSNGWDFDMSKNNLLDKAAQEKSIPAIEWLIAQGASFPEYLLCYLPLPSDRTSQEYILFLKSNGWDFDTYKNNLLDNAVSTKSITSIDWLISQGASFATTATWGIVPETQEVQDYLLFLKSKGLDLNQALATSSREKSIPAIDWLLSQGVSLLQDLSCELHLPSDPSSQEYILHIKSKGWNFDQYKHILLGRSISEKSIPAIEWLIAQGASFDEGFYFWVPLPEDIQTQEYLFLLQTKGWNFEEEKHELLKRAMDENASSSVEWLRAQGAVVQE